MTVAEAGAREEMVRVQLRARGIADERVLRAMLRVPRHRFLPDLPAERAYADSPQPIGFGQTISQPWIVARMSELLAVRATDRVLEIGAGCGYQTAVLAELARELFAVERIPQLATRARARLVELGYQNVTVAAFDGSGGWPAHAPYDAILVAAGAPRVPPLLCDQLADGGRLVVPVGDRDDQRLTLVRRSGARFELSRDTPCRFVDLLGRFGYDGPGSATA